GIRACAIVFMHGYRYGEHERIAAELAREVGFEQVSASHVVSPLLKFVSRGDTCVVDAYLSPILQRYVERIAAQMAGVPIYFMQSNGGLTSAEHFAGKDAVLSGPAGGIVGMAYTARAAGHDRVIGFDMGGTSTDVSHYAGELERSFETEVAGVRMRAPMMNIHTVAAGGGSVLHFDGARLRVGPDSAGANPGPACYRRGGPLTITDANLLLGKLQPEFFPRVFGSAGDEPLDRAIVERGFAELAARVRAESGRALDPEALAEGFIEIAVANMAHAIKKISVARGHDVTRYTLQCFGGAGGQHACRVADALGIERVFIHPLAGVLSAYGMGLADQTALRELAVEAPLDDGDASAMNDALERVCEQTSRALMDQGFAREQLRTLRRVHLRYEGSDGALPIAYDEVDAMRRAFEDEYRKRFGFVTPDKRLIVESVSAEAIAPGEPLREQRGQAHPHWPSAEARVRIYSGGFCEAALHRRHQLQGGARIDGPAVLVEDNATSVVELGWRAEIDGNGNLLLERIAPRAGREVGTEVDPIRLELFNNLFMNIAEQMGLRLQNSAHSVNIKERLDFSCALFDRSGQLIANAPHMPVHLGSMSESIATVIARNPAMQRGDVFALNDPYHGGTHLPDVTVVSPVFDEREERVLFYVASRGHHADIGSITPGSMPPFSTDIAEEGVLLDNVKLVSAGRLCERELLELLTRGPHPARNPEQNLADLRAQIAANEKGADELRAMVRQFGSNSVAAYMQHVQDNAEESVRRAIARLDRAIGDRGRFELTLDNGALIALTVTIDRARRWAVVDFSGSSHQLPNNFNAPRAVTMA
ncbi:MAG TPA: hydantoinase/oxoprolinase family protein, partial [Polyangiales bacterium]